MKKIFSVVLCSTFISACSGFYDYKTPELQSEASKEQLATEITTRYAAAEPIAQWWEGFSDPELAELVEDGLRHNLDVQTAIANVKEARALADRSFFDYFPTVSTNAGFSRRRINTTTFGGAAGGGPSSAAHAATKDPERPATTRPPRPRKSAGGWSPTDRPHHR